MQFVDNIPLGRPDGLFGPYDGNLFSSMLGYSNCKQSVAIRVAIIKTLTASGILLSFTVDFK